MRRLFSMLCIGLCTVACNTATPPQNPSTPVNPEPIARSELVAAGVTIPTQKEAIEEETAVIGLTAVAFASEVTGTLTVTGTITQTTNSFNYAPTPADSLKVEFANGETMEYIFEILEGDLEAASAETFLQKPHRLQYRVVYSSGSDLSISSVMTSSQYQVTLSGSIVFEGIRFTVSFVTQGSTFFESSPGVQHKTSGQTRGSVNSENFSATIDESEDYSFIFVQNSVIQYERIINNSWTVGNEQYALTGGRIYRGFQNAKPSSTEAEGILTRNGVAIGGLAVEDSLAKVDIVLLADGEKTGLYSAIK